MADAGQESFQEKTEPATQKKRDESRQKGKVVKSMEMNSALILVFGLLILSFGGAALAGSLANVAHGLFANAAAVDLNSANVHQLFVHGIAAVAIMVGPIIVGLMLVGLASSFAQVGFLFTFEPLQPNLGRLNPLSGMKKIFMSRRSTTEVGKNLLKVIIVGLVAYWTVDGMLPESLELMDGGPASVLQFMGHGALAVGLKVGIAFLALAVVDYMFQRHEYERELRMTKQEVKEEIKMQEGDPLIKGRIRGIQRQIAYKRMMHDVPTADVVVTNPTHYAVAIKYDMLKMSAPKVVAKGANLIAEKIKEIAAEHSVPVVEDKLLAQMLYKTVEIGEEIPQKLFQAVAQVLAYIYRLKNMKHRVGEN
jgi:flagellar biosynthetic protein FlhB